MGKDDVIERIRHELKDDPSQMGALLALWERTQAPRAEAATPEPEAGDAFQAQGGLVGLPHFFGYNNYAIQEWNTCGQAVIASFVNWTGKNPYKLQKKWRGPDGNTHYDPTELIGRVFKDFGPNWPWMNGVTVRETIMGAFNQYGIKNSEWFPGAFSNGDDARAQLTDWIAKYKKPVIVLVDTGKPIFGGSGANFGLHWCTVYAYDDHGVRIATWDKSYTVPWKPFMEAWHCWFLPYPNNFYAIRAWV